MGRPLNARYIFLLGAAGACGGLMFGFDVAIITGAGPFLIDQFALSPLSLGVAFSILLFGCALGALAAGPASDRYGRRPVMLAVAILFAVTCLSTALSPDFTTFLISRFVGGLAVGAVSLAAPTYVAELSPTAIRGRMGALYQLSIITGIAVSYLINYLLRDLGPDSWRYMFVTGVVPSLLYFAVMLRAPETPAFLVAIGRSDAARDLLDRIGGDDPDAALSRIEASLRRETREPALLSTPGFRRPLGVAIVLAILVHVSGINTVIDYAPFILKSAGFNLDAALLYTLVIGLANFAFTLVSFWTIDRFGRKPLYLVGSSGMAAALIGLAIAVETGHFEGGLVLFGIVVYVFFFCSCIGPAFWTLVPELLPNAVRGRAMAVPVMVQWLANAGVVLLFPHFFETIGRSTTFGILAAACVLQAIYVWRWVPETRGRALEDIQAFWTRSEAASARHG